MTDTESFEARYSPTRSFALFVLSFLFVAAGFWLVGAFGEIPVGWRKAPGWAVPIVGWVCLVFFGGAGLLHLRNVFSSGLAVRIDAHGVLAPALSKQIIAWSSIQRVRTANIMGTAFVVLDIDEARAQNLGLYGRLARRLNSLFYDGGWPVMINNTDRSADEVVAAARALHPVSQARALTVAPQEITG